MAGVSLWDLAIVLSKVLSYFGILTLIGSLFVILLARSPQSGSASSWSVATRKRLFNMMLLGALAGLLATPLFFLLQVGLLSQRGVAGMFDRLMASIVASSSIGQGSGLRLAGFGVMGLALLLWRRRWLGSAALPLWLVACWAVALVLFTLSFAVLGHVVNLSPIARVAVMLHVGMVGLWIGSLYPLHALARHEPGVAVQRLLGLFGRAASVVLAVLGIAGVYLVWGFFQASHGGFFSSDYGQLLLIKILLVGCLLLLAALNKFRLTPGLLEDGSRAITRSIAGEMLLAALILGVTATFTTVVGPGH